MKERKSPSEKNYTKPRLRKIELKADEVLAVGCKTSTPTTAALGGATCLVNNCVTLGS